MTDPLIGADIEVEALVHPTAIVDPNANLGKGVVVGPWSIIGPGVTIGDGTEIRSHVLIERNTIIREYATLNRGTAATLRTVVGDDCFLMTYSHVAHDCQIGNNVVLSNAVNMAGHVMIEDWAIIGGLTAIHQFVRIGAHAFVGGASRTSQDVPPYTKAAGSPMKLYGLNSVGLDRRGVSPEVRKALKRAYRIIFQSNLPLTQALDQAEAECKELPEVGHFINFIRKSERGVTT